MKMRLNLRIIAGALLALVAILSLSLYHWESRLFAMRTLFFPRRVGMDRGFERHRLPKAGNRQREMRLLAEEMLLGPISLDHSPVAPAGTILEIAILVERRLYISFSPDIMFVDEGESIADFERRIAAIVETMHFNFRSLDEVVVLIDGQVPTQGSFSLSVE